MLTDQVMYDVVKTKGLWRQRTAKNTW